VKNLTVIVDNSQRDTEIPKHLIDKDVTIEYANLRNGSFLISNAVAVERMTTDEFVKLTSEKLLFRRLLDFKKTYDEPMLIVEGKDIYKNKLVSIGSIRGAISYISCLNRIPLIFTADVKESAELIFIMANQTQFGLGYEVSVPESSVAVGEGGMPKPKTPAEIQAYIVQLLPDIGPSVAKSMMQMYGNLRTLFSATASDLTKVEGIGPKKAKKIIKIFDMEYNQKK